MAELGDVELQRAEDPEEPPSRAPLRTRLIAGLLVGVAIGLGYLAWRASTTPPPAAVQAQAEAPNATPSEVPAPVAEVEPAVVLPALDESDGTVRDLLRALSNHPRLAVWLAGDGLARRFTAALDNVATGKSPTTHLKALAPSGPFLVQRAGSRLTIDPAGYRRYDQLADVVASIDSQASARAYRTLKPLFAAAYRELGQAGEIDAAVERTIRLVLSAPLLEGPVELRQGQVLYEFADPALENKSAPEKHLLRMGPRNLRLIQGKAREVALALGIDAETE